MSISAVLPLKASGSYGANDLRRGHILFSSLSVFAEEGLFSAFYIVTPEDEVDLVRETYACWTRFKIEVISEHALVPELAKYPNMRGWRKQQIIKLAIASKIQTDYYMTFDADVICLKPLTKQVLFPKGKGILQYESCRQHPKWWKSSSRILKLGRRYQGMQQGMTVTPALLSKTISLAVQEEINACQGTDNWITWLCELHLPKHPKNWLLNRYLMLKWTEYSLYYMTALKRDILHDHHTICGSDTVPQCLLIHDSHPFEDWDPEKNFSDACPGLFCVVGSKAFLEPETVWTKVSDYINADVPQLESQPV